MWIRRSDSGFGQALAAEVTPPAVWAARRTLLQQAAAGALALPLSTWGQNQATPRPGVRPALAHSPSRLEGASTPERLTAYAHASGYNNFYEFGTDKSDPARLASGMALQPWTLQIDGLVKKPGRYALEDVMRWGAMQERIYRLRCVEGWSMVLPWIGYALSDLLARVQPLPSAKFVQFVTLADSASMPGLRSSVLEWPYSEGLRLDEAMHPLTLLAFGMYGELLPPQNGAPLRLVVPWKYGFKSAKSLVRIRLLEHQPPTSWEIAAPQEYGFYSNVNPTVDHPRWSQASERRIGEDGLLSKKRKTLMFNGYEPQVGQLYAGMDLKKHF